MNRIGQELLGGVLPVEPSGRRVPLLAFKVGDALPQSELLARRYTRTLSPKTVCAVVSPTQTVRYMCEGNSTDFGLKSKVRA